MVPFNQNYRKKWLRYGPRKNWLNVKKIDLEFTEIFSSTPIFFSWLVSFFFWVHRCFSGFLYVGLGWKGKEDWLCFLKIVETYFLFTMKWMWLLYIIKNLFRSSRWSDHMRWVIYGQIMIWRRENWLRTEKSQRCTSYCCYQTAHYVYQNGWRLVKIMSNNQL